jgi:phospholipase/lecithinase/hemolysin
LNRLALALVLIAPGVASAQTTLGRIVVFGTSLSDSGNAFALRGDLNTPPYNTLDVFLVPGAPYAKGGHHFSNGATWIEQLAGPLGLAGDARPAFQGPGTEATNYAVGGARAREDGINANLSFQVNTFLSDFNGTAPSDGLYVIEMGSNDVRDALAVFASGGDGSPILQQALAAIGNAIGTLYSAGARRFLVWNVPDIGLTPALRTLDRISPGAALLASNLADGFNTYLGVTLGQLQAYPGIQITKLDVFTIIREVNSQPMAFGLSVLDRACVMPNTPPFECKMPDEYLFWDGIHPTKAMHAIVAQDAAIELSLK